MSSNKCSVNKKRVVVYIKENVSAVHMDVRSQIPNVVIRLGAFLVAIVYSEFSSESIKMTEKLRIANLFEALNTISSSSRRL